MNAHLRLTTGTIPQHLDKWPLSGLPGSWADGQAIARANPSKASTWQALGKPLAYPAMPEGESSAGRKAY
jgi:hypothetical protein